MWEFRDFRSRVESVVTACVLFKREREYNNEIPLRYYLEKKKRREMREIERELIKNARSIKKKQGTNARTCPGTPAWPFFLLLLLLLLFVRENKDVCTD